MSSTAPAIESEEAYRALLAEAAILIESDPDPGSEEGQRLLALVDVLEPYEREHYPLDGEEC